MDTHNDSADNNSANANTTMQQAMGNVWQAQMGSNAKTAKKGSAVLSRIAGATRKQKADILRTLPTHRVDDLTPDMVTQALNVTAANKKSKNQHQQEESQPSDGGGSGGDVTIASMDLDAAIKDLQRADLLTTTTSPHSSASDSAGASLASAEWLKPTTSPLGDMMTLMDFANRHQINAVAAIATAAKAAASAASTTTTVPQQQQEPQVDVPPQNDASGLDDSNNNKNNKNKKKKRPLPMVQAAVDVLSSEKQKTAAALSAAVVPSTLPPPGQALNTSAIVMPSALSVYTQREAQLFQMVMHSVNYVKANKQLQVEQPPLISAQWMRTLVRRATGPYRECIRQANCMMALMDHPQHGRSACVQFHTPAQADFVKRTGQLPQRMANLCVLDLALLAVAAAANNSAQSTGQPGERLTLPFYNMVNRPGEYVKEACLQSMLGQLDGVFLSIRAPTINDFVPCMVDVAVPLRNATDNSLLRDTTGAVCHKIIQVPGFRERDELLFREGQSPLPVTRPAAPLATPVTEFSATAFEYSLRARTFGPTKALKTLAEVVAQDREPSKAPAFVAEQTFAYRIADMAFRPLLSAVRLVRHLAVANGWQEQQWYSFLNEHHILISPPPLSGSGGGGGGGGSTATAAAATGMTTSDADQQQQQQQQTMPSFIARLHMAVMTALHVNHHLRRQQQRKEEEDAADDTADVSMPDVREHLIFYMTCSRLECAEMIKDMLIDRSLESAYKPPSGAKARAANGKSAGVESFLAQLNQFQQAYIPLFDWFIKRLKVGAPIDDTTLLERSPADDGLSMEDVHGMHIANLILESDVDEHTSWMCMLEPRYQNEVRPGDFMFVQCRTVVEWQPSSAELIAQHYRLCAIATVARDATVTTGAEAVAPAVTMMKPVAMPLALTTAAATTTFNGGGGDNAVIHHLSTSTASPTSSAPVTGLEPAEASAAADTVMSLTPLEKRIAGTLLSSPSDVALLRNVLHDIMVNRGGDAGSSSSSGHAMDAQLLQDLDTCTFSNDLLAKVALFRTYPSLVPRHDYWKPDRVAISVPNANAPTSGAGAAAAAMPPRDAETIELIKHGEAWNRHIAAILFDANVNDSSSDGCERQRYAVLAALVDTLNRAMHRREIESARLNNLIALHNQLKSSLAATSKSASTAKQGGGRSSSSHHHRRHHATSTTNASTNTGATIATNNNKPLEQLFNAIGNYEDANAHVRANGRRHHSHHHHHHQRQPHDESESSEDVSSSSAITVATDDDDVDDENDDESKMDADNIDESKRDAIELQHFIDGELRELQDNEAFPDDLLEQRHHEVVNDYTLLGRKNLRSAIEMARSESATRFYEQLDERRAAADSLQWRYEDLAESDPEGAKMFQQALVNLLRQSRAMPVDAADAYYVPTDSSSDGADAVSDNNNNSTAQRFAFQASVTSVTASSSAPVRLNMPPPPHVAQVSVTDNNNNNSGKKEEPTAAAKPLEPMRPARVPLQALFRLGGVYEHMPKRGTEFIKQLLASSTPTTGSANEEDQRRELVLRLCVDYWTGLVHALTTFVHSHMRLTLAALQADDPCDEYFFQVAPQQVLSRLDLMMPNDTLSASERFLPDMTHHVLDMQHFIGNKNAMGTSGVATTTANASSSSANGKATAAAASTKDSSTATAAATTTSTTRKRSNSKAADASAVGGDSSTAAAAAAAPSSQPSITVYQAWNQVLQRAMPRVCHVHIATRHIVDFANASPEFLLCVLRLLRVSLMGGYRYEHQMVDYNTCLVLERMFIECEQAATTAACNASHLMASSVGSAQLHEQQQRILAPFRTFLSCNALVVLYAVREYLVRMIELSPSIDAFIRLHYRDYDMFVRYVRVCVGAMRVALSHNRSLQGINDQTAKALANKTSQKLWTSYRGESGATFVSKMCASFKRIDQDKVAMQIVRNPHAEQYHVEKLPAFVAETVYSYVCSLEPGESFKAHWLRDLGFREHTVELVHRLAAQYTKLSDKVVLNYLLALPDDEYSMLALFFHLLAYHAMRRLVPLEPCLTALQMTALRQHFHVPCDELVPEHLTTTHCCSALACYELLTAVNAGLRSTTRVAKQPGVRQDYETLDMFCTNKRMRRDQDNNTQQKRNRNTKKYELYKLTYEAMCKRPGDKTALAAFEAARDDFYAACMKNARLLVRSQYEYPCNETRAVGVPRVGHALQWCKIKDTPTPMLCTTCPRCAQYSVFSTALIDSNGYTCGLCDSLERSLMREPCCLVCARPVSITRDRNSVKQHNAMMNVRRMFAGYGYKASRKYEARAVATGASFRYRAADDIEPRSVLLVDDVGDWQLRPFMVCAQCWMSWMPAATLELTRSEFVFCAINRVDGPHQVYLGKQMEL